MTRESEASYARQEASLPGQLRDELTELNGLSADSSKPVAHKEVYQRQTGEVLQAMGDRGMFLPVRHEGIPDSDPLATPELDRAQATLPPRPAATPAPPVVQRQPGPSLHTLVSPKEGVDDPDRLIGRDVHVIAAELRRSPGWAGARSRLDKRFEPHGASAEDYLLHKAGEISRGWEPYTAHVWNDVYSRYTADGKLRQQPSPPRSRSTKSKVPESAPMTPSAPQSQAGVPPVAPVAVSEPTRPSREPEAWPEGVPRPYGATRDDADELFWRQGTKPDAYKEGIYKPTGKVTKRFERKMDGVDLAELGLPKRIQSDPTTPEPPRRIVRSLTRKEAHAYNDDNNSGTNKMTPEQASGATSADDTARAEERSDELRDILANGHAAMQARNEALLNSTQPTTSTESTTPEASSTVLSDGYAAMQARNQEMMNSYMGEAYRPAAEESASSTTPETPPPTPEDPTPEPPAPTTPEPAATPAPTPEAPAEAAPVEATPEADATEPETPTFESVRASLTELRQEVAFAIGDVARAKDAREGILFGGRNREALNEAIGGLEGAMSTYLNGASEKLAPILRDTAYAAEQMRSVDATFADQIARAEASGDTARVAELNQQRADNAAELHKLEQIPFEVQRMLTIDLALTRSSIERAQADVKGGKFAGKLRQMWKEHPKARIALGIGLAAGGILTGGVAGAAFVAGAAALRGAGTYMGAEGAISAGHKWNENRRERNATTDAQGQLSQNSDSLIRSEQEIMGDIGENGEANQTVRDFMVRHEEDLFGQDSLNGILNGDTEKTAEITKALLSDQMERVQRDALSSRRGKLIAATAAVGSMAAGFWMHHGSGGKGAAPGPKDPSGIKTPDANVARDLGARTPDGNLTAGQANERMDNFYRMVDRVQSGKQKLPEGWSTNTLGRIDGLRPKLGFTSTDQFTQFDRLTGNLSNEQLNIGGKLMSGQEYIRQNADTIAGLIKRGTSAESIARQIRGNVIN